jgi:hypothetical protein
VNQLRLTGIHQPNEFPIPHLFASSRSGDSGDAVSNKNTWLKSVKTLPPPRNLTVIICTQGEMANHLHLLAHSLRLKYWIESMFRHITVMLQVEHHDDKKYYTVLPLDVFRYYAII